MYKWNRLNLKPGLAGLHPWAPSGKIGLVTSKSSLFWAWSPPTCPPDLTGAQNSPLKDTICLKECDCDLSSACLISEEGIEQHMGMKVLPPEVTRSGCDLWSVKRSGHGYLGGVRVANSQSCCVPFGFHGPLHFLIWQHFQIRKVYMRSLTSGSSWKFAILPKFPQLAEDNHHGRDTASLPLAR